MIEEKPQEVASDSRVAVDTNAATLDIPREPKTVLGAFGEGLREFLQEEESGYVPAESIERMSSHALGERITSGMYVGNTNKVPMIHLHDVPVSRSLDNPQEVQEALLARLAEKDHLHGMTPSKAALRVISMVLRKLPDLPREDRKSVAAMTREAAEIDLDKPDDPDWQKSLTVRVGDESIDITLSLKRNSLFTRVLTPLLARDIPKEHRSRAYSYKVDIKNTHPYRTEALQKVEHRMAQVQAVATLTAPMALVTWATAKFMPTKVLPEFTSNQAVQSWAEFGAEVSPFVAAGVLSFMLMQKLQRERFR